MMNLPEISQLLTPTPMPVSNATPAIDLGLFVGDQMAVDAVGAWNTANQTGFLTTVQVVIVVLIVLGGFYMIFRQVREL